MKEIICFLKFMVLIVVLKNVNSCGDTVQDPDSFLQIDGIIIRHGYPMESHTAVTEDGYILLIQRIPHGKKNKHIKGPRPVVLLQHATLGSGADWVLLGPKQSLGFMMADKGYDVWLGNLRGNGVSMENINFRTNSNKFWNFTLDDFALYDLPATIDMILDKTNQQNLTVMGHSVGASVPLSTLALKPEFNDKINLVVAMAPSAFNSRTKIAVKLTAPFAKLIRKLEQVLFFGRLVPIRKIYQRTATELCSKLKHECVFIFFILSNFNLIKPDYITSVVGHFPAETSSRVNEQFSQQVLSGRFCQYDFGKKRNKEIYNSTEPPEYNLKNVKTPIAVFYAIHDFFVSPKDVKKLIRHLPNVIATKEVLSPEFNHLNFIYGFDNLGDIYNEMIEVVQKYNPVAREKL